MNDFSLKLIQWYQANKRHLPWRQTSDPYCIWLSEIILQQTRVDQGMGYYHRFLAKYPTIADLASAPLDEVLRLWQGLGYYSRARNLHLTANFIVDNYGGEFPSSFQELKKLRGIGHYTAAAVASIAFNEPVVVIDGNVTRFISRYLGLEALVGSIQSRREMEDALSVLFNASDPSLFNQALMEFGALQCKPATPVCLNCLFSEDCLAYKQGMVNVLPRRKEKKPLRTRYFNYLVWLADGQTLLQKRTDNDIWKMLYEFPCVESDQLLTVDKLVETARWKELASQTDNNFFIQPLGPFRQLLSHQEIISGFTIIRLNASFTTIPDHLIMVAVNRLQEYAFPRTISKFLEEHLAINL